MESIVRQLDQVRDEMVNLLQEYPYASDWDRRLIYERCESLGGEVQELIGLLKLAIRKADRDAAAEADRDPQYSKEIAQLSRESLVALHEAGREVAHVISMLRETRDPAEDLDCQSGNLDS